LFLVSLSTTHGEASLPISIAQRGGLREVGARGTGDSFLTKHARSDRRLRTH
jgi:hypothetical protein